MSANSFGGALLLRQAITLTRDPDIRRKLIFAGLLLAGQTSLLDCNPKSLSFYCEQFLSSAQPSECRDPPMALNDPAFEAGATVTLRTPAAGNNGVTLFARTGVLVPIDDKSSAPVPTGFAPVSTTGQASLEEHWTVPLLVGVTVPAKNLGVPIQNLSFEAFVGGQVQNQTLGFTLNEVGLPGTATASTSYTTLDPAMGAGLQYYLGTFYGVPTSLGASYTVDIFTANKQVTAPSPNFPGIEYTLANPARVSGTAAVTLNFDIPTK